jgi:hypothetical protein
MENNIGSPDDVVSIVLAGVTWTWQNADRFDQWDFLRHTMHGAALAMIGVGYREAEDEFYFLRDIAAIRNTMKKDAS